MALPQKILQLLQDNNLEEEEILLILAIRYKYKFGKIIIEARNGQVIRVLRAFESEELQGQDLMEKAQDLTNSM